MMETKTIIKKVINDFRLNEHTRQREKEEKEEEEEDEGGEKRKILSKINKKKRNGKPKK